MATLLRKDFLYSLILFFAVVIVLKTNQYIFYAYATSPAIILMPAGIALAAVYLKGYSMWFPLALAWLVATITNPTHLPVQIVAAATIAYPLQSVIGAYLLRRLKFSGTMGRIRDALTLVGIALALPVLAPSITSGVQFLSGSLTAPLWITWSRSWAGGVMSIMVFTPFITSWYRQRTAKSPRELIESLLALATLVLTVYLTFWTKLPQINTFLVLYGLFTVLFWIGLRMRPRIITTAIFLIAAFGMAGSIIAYPSNIPLNQQLFADELFIVLIAPIFFILSALVEEGRVYAQEAQKRASELEEVNRKLSHEDKLKNDFLATLAHELRNPLAPLVSSLELIEVKASEIGRPDLVELVTQANRSNAVISQLLDDLLDISRISRKKFNLQKEITALAPLVEHAKKTVETLYNSRQHTLTVSVSHEKMRVEVDPLRLEQILVNLLNNAAKYTPPGGRVHLDVLYNSEKGVRISVKDNGIGIASDMLTKIFEPFIQSNNGGGGLGIGLSLTKRLVELHGGRIWAQSNGLGAGSEFVVVFPGMRNIPITPQPATATVRRKFFPLGTKKKPTRAFNILVVDDNKEAAKSMQKLLEHGGHQVSIVHDGPSAITAMSNAEAEVVLLDIGLPGMTGYEVAKNLRSTYGENPLVLLALTGYGQDEDKAKAHEAGFNQHLTKPVGIAEIETILARIK
jgi:signal transduction histidine kinase